MYVSHSLPVHRYFNCLYLQVWPRASLWLGCLLFDRGFVLELALGSPGSRKRLNQECAWKGPEAK